MRHHRANPLDRLLLAMGAAAVHVHIEAACKIAAREADKLPRTDIERNPRALKAKLLAQGRTLMRELKEAAPERRAQIAAELKLCVSEVRAKQRAPEHVVELGKKHREHRPVH